MRRPAPVGSHRCLSTVVGPDEDVLEHLPSSRNALRKVAISVLVDDSFIIQDPAVTHGRLSCESLRCDGVAARLSYPSGIESLPCLAVSDLDDMLRPGNF